MAVALDALMTAGDGDGGRALNGDNVTSKSGTGITVGASASLLVVVVCYQASQPITSRAITWNGVAMTEVAAGSTSMNTDIVASIWTLVNPAPGANTIAATWVTTAGSADIYLSAVSFTGTNTTTGINAADSVSGSTGSTVTVTSASGDATVAISARDGNDPTVNFNEIFSEAPLNPGAGASYQLGGTSNVHTFTFGTGTENAWAGIHIIAAAGGGGGITDGWKILLH